MRSSPSAVSAARAHWQHRFYRLRSLAHTVSSFPKAPCTDMVTTWALKGLLYHGFGAYVYTIVVLGAFGFVEFEVSGSHRQIFVMVSGAGSVEYWVLGPASYGQEPALQTQGLYFRDQRNHKIGVFYQILLKYHYGIWTINVFGAV